MKKKLWLLILSACFFIVMQVEKRSWYEGKNRYIWFAEELKEEDKVSIMNVIINERLLL